MNDLSALLDATQPATCEFTAGPQTVTITLDVYTAGASRLTFEEKELLREMRDRCEPGYQRIKELQVEFDACNAKLKEALDDKDASDSLTKINKEIDRRADTLLVDVGRVSLPMMIKGWSLNGSPMQRNGKDFPPTAENVATIPDAMLLAIAEKVKPVWENPTTGEDSPNTLAQEVNSEASRTDTTTPSQTFAAPQDGSAATP